MMNLSRMKLLLFSGGKRLLNSSASVNNLITPSKTKPNFESTQTWAKMDETSKMSYALAENEPETAKMAFYKGLGFKKLGSGYYNEAITAFEKAIELDKTCSVPAARQIASIYVSLGQIKKASEVIRRALDDLVVTMLDSENMEHKTFEIMRKALDDLVITKIGPENMELMELLWIDASIGSKSDSSSIAAPYKAFNPH